MYYKLMIPEIETHIKQLHQICRGHHVKKLFLFGSAAKGTFNEATSDLDFVVEFNDEINMTDYADNYFSLLDSLEELFGRQIDLLSFSAIKNPIMKQAVESSKVQLYAA